MDARSCRSCGRLFNYMGGQPICQACKDALEKKFTEVRDYIRENKKAPLELISEDCEVSVKQLKQWIKEERLTFADDSPVAFECENCGTTIRTGRLCAACKAKLGDSLGSMIPKDEPAFSTSRDSRDDKNRMRFL